MIPKMISGLEFRNVDREVLVHDVVGGKVHVLNGTAATILEHCDGTHSMVEIVSCLAEIFGRDPTEVEPDVLTFLDQLRELGLLL